jgi:NADPH-dependent 2,4-dienoyl-CoA reductase/sulfur reductase-like enzyme
VRADLAVVAVGTHPRTDWLHGNGWDLTDGVLCAPSTHVLDRYGRALPRIVAAGDVARWPNLRFEHTSRRVEHWINAIEMGQAAADALLTGPDRAAAFTPIPRFWSPQHGVRIQSVGTPQLGTQIQVLHGSTASRRVVAGFTRPAVDGTPLLVGAIAWTCPAPCCATAT